VNPVNEPRGPQRFHGETGTRALSNPLICCYMKLMTSLRLALFPAFALGLASCFNKGNADTAYDTSNPYGAPQYGAQTAAQPTAQPPAAEAPAAPATNPVYDTPAAYEENTGRPSAPPPVDSAIVDPGIAPGAPKPASHKPSAPSSTPAAPSNVALSGTIHTVAKGDSLWAISRKYGVSVDALKKANGMTKDTVVIGQKLQIPAR
jgi:LysM repeat protein